MRLLLIKSLDSTKHKMKDQEQVLLLKQYAILKPHLSFLSFLKCYFISNTLKLLSKQFERTLHLKKSHSKIKSTKLHLLNVHPSIYS